MPDRTMPICKNDLNHDVVKAVIDHYRHCDSKTRIASMQGALFVLKWQEAEKVSGQELARFAIDSACRLQGEVDQSVETERKEPPPHVWELLERLANAAVRAPGCSEEEHAASVAADVGAAKALVEAYRRNRRF